MTDTHTTSHIPDEAVQAAYSASYGKIGLAIGKNPSEVMRAALTAALNVETSNDQ